MKIFRLLKYIYYRLWLKGISPSIRCLSRRYQCPNDGGVLSVCALWWRARKILVSASSSFPFLAWTALPSTNSLKCSPTIVNCVREYTLATHSAYAQGWFLTFYKDALLTDRKQRSTSVPFSVFLCFKVKRNDTETVSRPFRFAKLK